MIRKEKITIASACLLTVGISAGFTITQGEIKPNLKDYRSINTANQIDIKINYKLIEKDISENLYTIQVNKSLSNQDILKISEEIVKENKDKYTININENDKLKAKVNKNETGMLITTYIPVEKEIEGLPEEYKVLAIEPFEEKTRISIEIPSSDQPDLVLGQVKSIGQKVKDEEREKGNDLGSLEIKAYYNEENNYWSYSSSNKNVIMKNEVIPN